MSFNLRGEVRHILDTTDLTDPGEIAEKVFSGIPSGAFEDVVRVTLRPFVADVMGSERRRSAGFSNTGQCETGTQRGDASVGDETGAGTTSQVGPGTQRRPAGGDPSWKRRSIRNIHRQRIYVGNEWKMLGDCTVADIDSAALDRRATAQQNKAWADRYDQLSLRMSQSHAGVVSDMSQDMVAAILNGESG